MIKDPELEILIEELETRGDMPVADFEGVVNALKYLLPDEVAGGLTPQGISTTDGALLLADDAFPHWYLAIHGRTDKRDGHWRCSLRRSENRDNDAALGHGRSPVLRRSLRRCCGSR